MAHDATEVRMGMRKRVIVALGGSVTACTFGVACTSLLGDLPGGTALTDAGGSDVTTADGPASDSGAPGDAASDAPVGDTGSPPADSGATDSSDGGGGDPVAQISVGGSAACAVTKSGALYCWGANPSGSVGDGTSKPRASAVHITTDVNGSAIGPVAQVSVGFAHTCARLRDSSVYCWGNDDAGQLGDGNFLPTADAGAADKHAPQKIPNLTTTSIGCGQFHTCALSGGTGYVCWGSNGYGELGHTPGTMGDVMLGSFFYNYANSSPLGGASVPDTTLSAGGLEFTCANSTVQNNVDCWGINTGGQTGEIPDASGQYLPNPGPMPVYVQGNAYISASHEISLGWGHGCASDGQGNAYCWGSNGAGQLGASLPVASSSPSVAIQVAGSVSHIASGYYTTCAVLATQQVQCWGGNKYGELGHDPSTDPIQSCPDNSGPCDPNPTTVSIGSTALSPVASVSVGLGAVCALKTDGTVWCWGTSPFTLGDGGLTVTPTQMMGLP